MRYLSFHDAAPESIEESDGLLTLRFSHVLAYPSTKINPRKCSIDITNMKLTAESFRIIQNTLRCPLPLETADAETDGNIFTLTFADNGGVFSFSFGRLSAYWDKFTENSADYYHAAKEHFGNGDPGKALYLLRKAADTDEHYAVYELMYRCCDACGEKARAFKCISRAYSLNSRNDRCAYEYARELYYYKYDPAAAKHVLNGLLERNGTYGAAKKLIAEIDKHTLREGKAEKGY